MFKSDFIYTLFTMFAYLIINEVFCQQQKRLRVGKNSVNAATNPTSVDFDGADVG